MRLNLSNVFTSFVFDQVLMHCFTYHKREQEKETVKEEKYINI